MELKELQEILDKDEKKGKIVEKAYWEELWQHYIEEKSQDYRSLEVKDAIPKLISDMNLRERRNITNCNESVSYTHLDVYKRQDPSQCSCYCGYRIVVWCCNAGTVKGCTWYPNPTLPFV